MFVPSEEEETDELLEDEDEYTYEEIDEEEEETEEKGTDTNGPTAKWEDDEDRQNNGTTRGNDHLANLADECRSLLEVPEEALERETKLKMGDGWDRRFWMPNSDEGFELCEVRSMGKNSEKEDNVEVKVMTMDDDGRRGQREKEEHLKVQMVRRESLQRVSVSHLCHDLCQLSELNDASVLAALRQRYSLRLIHTYSALFCVVVNPWCPLVPLYCAQMRSHYANAKVGSLPPHVFAIAQSAFDGVTDSTSQQNQSILITGESGAGKTENTKRIIEYLMDIAERNAKVSECSDQKKAATVEKALISAGIALEAFANAQTMHNNNSSRMGKFVRIDFDRNGKLRSAQINCYLLEKSRVVSQNAGDRNFHIFYQLFTRSDFLHSEKGSRILCRVWDYRNPYSGDTPRPDGFRFLNQGKVVENVHAKFVNDSEDSRETELALDQLGFSPLEKGWVRELVIACVIIGEVRFGERHGMDISFVEEMTEVEAVAELLGVRANALVDALTQPSIRVGDALIRRSQPLRKTLCAAQSLAKCVYERLFSWVVSKCNSAIQRGHSAEETIARESSKMIGVLDMAGFEIMSSNSFEQLCINYTNERLQQFFNEFMFIREQEEYVREGISWEYVKDFGRDLQPTIDLIEKPLGILSLLQEECIVPNGSDQSLLDKFVRRLSSVSPGGAFSKVKQSNRTPSHHHFTIAHYAGLVGYSVDGWLEKNRDAVDGALLQLLASSSHSLTSQLFAPRECVGKPSSPRGSAMAQATISHVYREQLASLLRTLRDTQAHFIRCIVPNHRRQPFEIDGPLVMHQLRCNGVLEGIRICRQGYPNRICYATFLARFRLLHPSSVPLTGDPRESVQRLFSAVGIGSAQFQLGRSKVFCRVGLISQLEALRRERLNECVSKLQALIRWANATEECRRRREQWLSVCVVQRSVRHFVHVRRWLWFRLWLRVRQVIPLVSERQRMAEVKAENVKMQKELTEAKNDAEKTRTELRELAERTERNETQWKNDREKATELSAELRRNEELLEKMERKFDDQHAKIVRLNNTLGEHAKALERTEEEKNAMKTELQTLREQFRLERIERESAEESLRLAQQECVNARVEMDEMGAEVRRIRMEMSRRAEELEQSKEKTREQQTQLTELNRALSEANDRLGEMQPQIHAEKSAKRKAEGLVEELEVEIGRINNELDKANVKRDAMKEQLRVRDAQVRKLERNLEDKSAQMDECVQEMKKAHKRTQNEVQEQLEENRRKCIRMERENAQMKSKLETMKKENEMELQKSQSRVCMDKIGSTSALNSTNNTYRESSVDSDCGGGGAPQGLCRSMTARHSLHNASSANSSSSLHRPYRCYRTHAASSTVLSDPYSVGLRRSASGTSSVHSSAASSSFFRRHENSTANPMLISLTTTADSGLLTRSPSSASTISGTQQPPQQQSNAMTAQRLDEAERRATTLERELQQQRQDAQMSRRELDVYKQMARRELEDSERDRESLGKQLRCLNVELDSLRNELKKEQEQSQTLKFEMRKVRGENGTLRKREEDEREESRTTIAIEKKKHAERVEELTNEFNSRIRQVVNAQRSTEQLQTKLAETECQLDRALGQLTHLERLQKTQNTIGETWEAQYRTTQSELQSVRDENSALKCKIRRQQRQIELLTQQSEMDSRVNELEEKIGSLGGTTMANGHNGGEEEEKQKKNNNGEGGQRG